MILMRCLSGRIAPHGNGVINLARMGGSGPGGEGRGTSFTFQNCGNKKSFCTIPTGAKSHSSHQWLRRHLNDPYVAEARYRNYRARSAFKLLEIDDKYGIIRPGMAILDCGAAPGAWCQVITQRTGLVATREVTVSGRGRPAAARGSKVVPVEGATAEQVARTLIIGIDLNHLQPIEGVHLLTKSDFTKPLSQAAIMNRLGDRKLDLVTSDMAPEASGVQEHDHERIAQLCYAALTFSLLHLSVGGSFLCKIWDGGRRRSFTEDVGKFFSHVVNVKPESSRKESSEIFILARDFKGLSGG